MPIFPATSVDFFLAGLEAFMRRSGQGDHLAVTMLRLDGKPDAERLTRAWEQLHARQPMLGARLARLWRGWRLVWQSDGAISAPPILWHAAQAEPWDDSIVLERLRGRCGAQKVTAPLWLEVFPVEGGREYVVLLTWRHALLDGTGVNLLLEKLAAESADVDAPVPPLPVREGLGGAFQKARPLMKRLHEMTAAGCLSAWAKGMSFGGAPAFRLIELSVEETQKAVALLRASCGDFMQMPFYAAVTSRALNWLHRKRGWSSPVVHLQMPFQPRGRSKELIFGNQMSALPLFLEAAAFGTMKDALQHLLEKYREAMKQEMPKASEALMLLGAQMPAGCFIPAVRLTNRGQICSLFHSHTGSFLPGRTEFAGAALSNVYTIPGVSAPPGLGLFFSDFGGRITATLSWREGCLSAEEAEMICRRVRADLTGEGAE